MNSKDYEVAQLAISNGAFKLGVELNAIQLNQLLKYTELLIKWNKVYSLTAITKLNDILTYHLLDGLTVVPHLKGYTSIIDVG